VTKKELLEKRTMLNKWMKQVSREQKSQETFDAGLNLFKMTDRLRSLLMVVNQQIGVLSK